MKRAGAAVLVAGMLTGCRMGAPLPALPEVSTAAFLPAIRTEIEAAITAVQVVWPDGRVERWNAPTINRMVKLIRGTGYSH